MANRFSPMVDDFYDKAFQVFEQEINQAALEAEVDEMGPIDAFTHVMNKVNATYEELAAAFGYDSSGDLSFGVLDDMVYEQTDPFLKRAEAELKTMVLDMFQSETFGDAVQKGEALKKVIQNSAIGDNLGLFDMNLKDERQSTK